MGNTIIFEGEYLNGERNGKGKEYDTCGYKLNFEGEYLNGKKNGKGKEYNTKLNQISFEGYYLNGKKMELVKNFIQMVWYISKGIL